MSDQETFDIDAAIKLAREFAMLKKCLFYEDMVDVGTLERRVAILKEKKEQMLQDARVVTELMVAKKMVTPEQKEYLAALFEAI